MCSEAHEKDLYIDMEGLLVGNLANRQNLGNHNIDKV